MSLRELIDAVAWRREEYGRERERLTQERREHRDAANELERLRERNGAELAGYLLPDLDDEDLAKLERRLRYPALLNEKRKTELELAALERERLQIEADPRYIEREVRGVDLESQRAEIADAAAAFRKERAVWECNKHFVALKERGWFEPDYDGGMFEWLRSWRNCSLLMAFLEDEFPGRKYPDDDDVRRGWNELFEASEPVMRLERDLHDKQAELDALAARHEALTKAPGEAFQRLYRRLGGMLVDHLRQAPEDLLVALGRDDEVLATFIKKDVGMKKQAAYLQELAVTRIDTAIQRLDEETRNLNLKYHKLQIKLARGKLVRVTRDDIARMRTVPGAKWDARRASMAKTRGRVSSFDDYDRGSFLQTYLWWDLMTHGARGDDLYEVRTFHERNPGWRVDTFHDPLDDAHDHVADANDLAAPDAVAAMLAADDVTSVDPS